MLDGKRFFYQEYYMHIELYCKFTTQNKKLCY
jgi:hypothetical protein